MVLHPSAMDSELISSSTHWLQSSPPMTLSVLSASSSVAASSVVVFQLSSSREMVFPVTLWPIGLIAERQNSSVLALGRTPAARL